MKLYDKNAIARLLDITPKQVAELTEKGMAVKENVAQLASEELDFGNFGTCSESERRALTIEMVRSLIKSAWKGYNRYVVKK